MEESAKSQSSTVGKWISDGGKGVNITNLTSLKCLVLDLEFFQGPVPVSYAKYQTVVAD